MTKLSGTLSELGEFALIDALQSLVAPHAAVLLGPGDDAAVVAMPGPLLVSSDLLVEGRHFRREWCEASDVGRRAAAASLADVAAMGGSAAALLVGFAAPGSLDAQWAYDMTRGLAEEAARVEAGIAGGDVTQSDVIVVAVTALGSAQQPPVTRAGARPGDVVALAGRLGWAAAGLAVLSRGFRSPRVVVEAYRRPEPPYGAGPEAAAAGATAMIDVSDGLLADLGHVARASEVAIDVLTGAVALAEPVTAVAAAVGVDPLHLYLTGGDDHALAATFPAEAELPQGWRRIGSVGAGSGVTVDGSAYEGPAGHEHFR
ncbi:MAG: thiamine-phosphate kinase [Actinomycetota bacterium]|nr:thiamine-phosphate kinase [Actinomycetota bacterium]